MNNLKVSVIVPCFNEEKTIEQVLLQILNQKDIINEVIVVDDKSTDNTKQKVIDYIKSNKTKNIHLYSGDGISKSKNIYKNSPKVNYLIFNK